MAPQRSLGTRGCVFLGKRMPRRPGFETPSYWHTHEHNHNLLTHSHDYGRQDEEGHHAQEAHIHDHAAPAESPA